ncbi:MAG: IS6 family transposase [Mesorhizobium sp.]|nr:IS6 family transposase [Mesorhizobium sp. M5C.F.Ca.IN.020.29.1.1]RWA95980.1 MAG: IS6 family transposase [Mesorhizobium sp.]TGT92659.1 IS6 family transposase [Mesorhizobium sp. M5C.F.Ca.ET.164.01.1.1]RWC20907.1 MAG: IS6 family transposase [Mesorhizobium sp.]RWD75686.1 MAG: IS6 family transposase [Mesorhizobium sp.]
MHTSYKRQRSTAELVPHAVWALLAVPLGLRLVEEILERGIVVSCETIRRWRKRFGPECVRRLRAKRPSPNDVWHLDEVLITIPGKKLWLWRAVDQDCLAAKHHHCQAAFPWSGETAGHAEWRAPRARASTTVPRIPTSRCERAIQYFWANCHVISFGWGQSRYNGFPKLMCK